jgi:predicted nucleic acid-binding protein
MSAEAAFEFVDANVLVYAFDASAGEKKSAAEQLLRRLWDAGTGRLSVQVLQEFFVTVTVKVARPMPAEDAAARIREFTVWKVFSPRASDVLRAIRIHEQSGISFWDAMVVHAAAESGCDVLWTEDLNDGQVIGGVRISNPFTSK